MEKQGDADDGGRVGRFLVFGQHPHRERIVKGSISSLIIDKHKGEGCERGSKRKANSLSVNACNSIF